MSNPSPAFVTRCQLDTALTLSVHLPPLPLFRSMLTMAIISDGVGMAHRKISSVKRANPRKCAAATVASLLKLRLVILLDPPPRIGPKHERMDVRRGNGGEGVPWYGRRCCRPLRS